MRALEKDGERQKQNYKGENMDENEIVLTRNGMHAIIKMVEEKVKQIPSDQLVSLECISQLLTVINQYALWVDHLKQEFLKMDVIIKRQNEFIKENGLNNRIILPN